MLIFPADLKDFPDQIGAKTKNLKGLADLGLEIPQFIAIPTSGIATLYSKNKLDVQKVKSLVQGILARLPLQQYAVRSSALIEDSAQDSFAGQFQSKLAQAPEQLESAIIQILDHAFKYLKGDIKCFSLIIQEYIEADLAGVAFTRNPLGGREMVIEYHRGRGEDIVSGKVKPERIAFYWTQEKIGPSLPSMEKNIVTLKTIESSLKFPQDIEWCIKNDRWYFLQTRPITTLSQKQYEEALYLDKTLSTRKSFFLEKTEITEIAPRPTPFTLSLLTQFYAPEGPIAQVYKKYGIHYHHRDFINIIGNELYVDREKEIQTILPAYRYNKETLQPQLKSWKGLLVSFKNIFSLNRISLKVYDDIKEKICKSLAQKTISEKTFEQRIYAFMQDYQIIFEGNLLADKALKKLKFALKSEKIRPAQALSLEVTTAENISPWNEIKIPDIKTQSKTWSGNSLEISDESPFFRSDSNTQKDLEAEDWFRTLPKFKKAYLQNIIWEAQKLSRLREYGRWLTIKNIHDLRLNLITLARELSFSKHTHLYFFSISEIIKKENLNEKTASDREIAYQKFDEYQLPARLFDTLQMVTSQKPSGISPGKARGRLVNLENLDKTRKNNILYTKMLTPDLTAYFKSINGIISEQGGLLSHLAIIAREKGIPVIVNFNQTDSSLAWNDEIEIDGGNGTIKKL